MTIFILCCALAGAVLGLRFKVLVLMPALGFVLPATVISAFAQGDGAWAIAGACAMAATLLEIGYLAGTLTRFTLAGARVARRRASPRATTALTGRPVR